MTAAKKILIYKALIFLFAFAVAFMPSTVSRSREVNSRVIVEILGVDGGEKVSVTAQYVSPTEAKDGTGKDTVTVEGKTLTEAVEALNTALGRRAELGHCSMVVVGKDAEPHLLGTLLTATDVTADVYVTAAEDKASDLIGKVTAFMKKTGATDADFIAYSAKRAHVATNTLLGFLSDLGSASGTAFIPVVETLEESSSGGDGSGESGESGGSGGGGQEGGSGGGQEGGSGGQGGKDDQKGMKVERLALYNKDGRAGILERAAAHGVAWVSAPGENGIVVADVEHDGETVKNVSAKLLKKSAKIKTVAGGRAVVKVKATLEPNGDSFNRLDSMPGDAVDAIKKGFSKAIKKEIEAAYADGLQLGCDPLFIGREFYRYAPEYFLSSYRPHDVDVEIAVEVSIK